MDLNFIRYGKLLLRARPVATMRERRLLLSALVGFLLIGCVAAVTDLVSCRVQSRTEGCDGQQRALAAATSAAVGAILGILTRSPEDN